MNNSEKYNNDNFEINGYKPLSREPLLSPKSELITKLTKEQIENITFYKRLITSKDKILLKSDNIPDEIVKHVVEYNYDVLNPNLAYCIDDRTTEKQDKGVYTPGGTDGILGAAFHLLKRHNLNLDPQEVYNILIDTIGEGNYYTHSDTHNIDKKGRIGCGHCNQTFNNPEHLLNLDQGDIDFMTELREEAKENSSIDILEGEHNPKGVILIDNIGAPDKLSIVPKGKEGGYFIYNRNAEKNILSRFVENLNQHKDIKINLDEKKLDSLAFYAYLSTLKYLGAGELPHCILKYNQKEGKYQLKSVGNVNDFIKNHS